MGYEIWDMGNGILEMGYGIWDKGNGMSKDHSGGLSANALLR